MQWKESRGVRPELTTGFTGHAPASSPCDRKKTHEIITPSTYVIQENLAGFLRAEELMLQLEILLALPLHTRPELVIIVTSL